jgi:hypothetical protein
VSACGGPGASDPAVDEDEPCAGDGQTAVFVVDDAAAIVVAEYGVVEGG